MRKVFAGAMAERASRPDFVFLTGDLGYNALEPLRDALGDRFLNAGVAEQNMVSVAAGLCAAGLRPWVYSISSFLYARAYEQIRNDVCLHGLPVRLVGNGGGYSYGVMGATHHALEDYGSLLCLPNMRAFVPAFAADVPAIAAKLFDGGGPAYLRLERDEKPAGFPLPPYAAWRRLLNGGGATVAVVGALAGGLWKALSDLEDARRPNLWVIAELPIAAASIPAEFLKDLAGSRRLIAVEEHAAQGGAGQALAAVLAGMGKLPAEFVHRHARGYPGGRYGSQAYHREESGLDPASLRSEL